MNQEQTFHINFQDRKLAYEFRDKLISMQISNKVTYKINPTENNDDSTYKVEFTVTLDKILEFIDKIYSKRTIDGLLNSDYLI